MVSYDPHGMRYTPNLGRPTFSDPNPRGFGHSLWLHSEDDDQELPGRVH